MREPRQPPPVTRPVQPGRRWSHGGSGVPRGAAPRRPGVCDTFGDDRAWVANPPQAEPPLGVAMPRRLHALWRKIFIGQIKPDDAQIAALGSAAVAATVELVKVYFPEKNTAQ